MCINLVTNERHIYEKTVRENHKVKHTKLKKKWIIIAVYDETIVFILKEHQ